VAFFKETEYMSDNNSPELREHTLEDGRIAITTPVETEDFTFERLVALKTQDGELLWERKS
jgi:hypothetical protein